MNDAVFRVILVFHLVVFAMLLVYGVLLVAIAAWDKFVRTPKSKPEVPR